MMKMLRAFERAIVTALLVMMMLIVLLSCIELAVLIVQQILQGGRFGLLDINELFTVFGFFLMVLIGLELLETVKMYLQEEVVHAECTFLVAIIAITRKVIILDVKEVEPGSLLGIAALVIALAAGYFLLKRAMQQKGG
jgi:uncharacterized membrane protein (DUF373 family)